MKPTPKILWLDCLGGLVVGIIVLIFCTALCRWEGLPLGVVVFLAIMNLAYGAFSLYVTLGNPRPIKLVRTLAIANMAWLIVCIAIAIAWINSITTLGSVHVVGEGLYVAALGFTEWRWQDELGN